MIRRLVILGASGDLTARYLLPALGRLVEESKLPHGFEVRGIARDEWNTAAFRDHAARALAAAGISAAARSALVEALDFRPADVTNPDALTAAVEPARGPTIVYLSLPPGLFPATVDALGNASLQPGSRIVVEKPFGTNLESAKELNRKLHRAFPEPSVFRVDHFLSEQTVQNVLGLRFANRIFDPLWNREHIERVEIVWDETLALEGRAAYYDTAGALRDMTQNHLLQLLCVIAMDAPAALDERELRDRKVQLLRAVRSPSSAEIADRFRRGRYTAGRIGDREVPGYVDEDGVDAERMTETFATVTLYIENWRWAGVPFVLRTGKALARDRREITIHLRPVPHLAFDQAHDPVPNYLRLELDPDRLALAININGPGDPFDLECVELERQLEPQALPAYARLLLDVLEGDPVFSIRADEAEEAWRIVEPVLSAWEAGRAPLAEYAAGTSGPS